LSSRRGSAAIHCPLDSVSPRYPSALRDTPSFPTLRTSDLGEGREGGNADGEQGGRDGDDQAVDEGPAHASRPQNLPVVLEGVLGDRKSTRLNSSHVKTSYAVFCLKKKNAGQQSSRAERLSC